MAAVVESVRPVDSEAASAPSGRDRRLLWTLLAIAAAGMVLRSVNLFDAPIRTDEPTITMRAVAAAQGDLVPDGFGYPPFAAYLLAGVLRIVAVAKPTVLTATDQAFAVARVTFVLLSGVGIAVTGLLGARVAGHHRQHSDLTVDEEGSRWLVGVGAALAMAISFHSVRLGNHARPDQVQLIAVVLALLATIRWDRDRAMRWLVAAGTAAGVAAATKYNGGAVVLVTLGAIIWPPVSGATADSTPSWTTRLRDVMLLGLVSMAMFVVASAGTVVTNFGEFWDGFLAEFQHQAGQHLGFEPQGNSAWFHLSISLPGNWGWPLTLASLAGLGLVIWRGSRPQRFVAAFAVLGLLFAVSSQVRFPHYVLLPLPALAVLAFVAVDRARRLDRRVAGVLLAAIGLAAVLTLTDDLRLVRALSADHTQDLAVALEAPYAEELVIEAYTARGAERIRTMFSLSEDPDITECGCVVALSSFQEERFRNRPDLYPTEIARYDRIRQVGELLGQVGPDRPLPYNWNLLPRWGVRDIPLAGPIGAVGPQISLFRMPGPP